MSEPDDRWQVKDSGTTWGPYPDQEQKPPSWQPAPEIPMSRTWPWIAGLSLVLRILLPLILLVAIIGVIVYAVT